MSTATMEFADTTKKLGDQIMGLTLKEAKELSDYLKDVHGIEPAAGGAVGYLRAETDVWPLLAVRTGRVRVESRHAGSQHRERR